jgi:hypothetical protein
VKRTIENEPIGVHICVEISQGNSQCSYLCLKQAKMSCFSFYLFSFTKSEQRVEQVLQGGGLGTSWGREVAGKEGRRVNMVQKCVHMYV